ncbi:MAG: SGNH/GDSL hydrolase family protein [Kiritimatiellae bacterium]|nr:SGNH/GDSL hydrolase family protein [Kiritimatiellia bacterium]
MKRRRLSAKLGLSLVAFLLALFAAEMVLRRREKRIAAADIQWLEHSNVDSLVRRRADDPLRVRFFNGCRVDGRTTRPEPGLGWINIPDTRGYSIRVYGEPNLVVAEPFDLSVFESKGVRTEVAPFRINNLGNRGADMPARKPPGARRIVFLGDSITFGYYVKEEDTFVARVGRELTAQAPDGVTIEVVNAGVSSLNVQNILEHLRQRALAWSPDLVVWSFYVNDIHDTGGQEADVLFPVRRNGWLRPLRSLALGRFLDACLVATESGARMSMETEDPVTREVERDWQNAQQAILEAKKLLAAQGASLIVAVFPSGIQFARPWTVPRYQSRLARMCRAHGVPCIDLLPALERAGAVGELYYGGDLIHPNHRGHAVAASEITAFVKSHPALIAPAPPSDL